MNKALYKSYAIECISSLVLLTFFIFLYYPDNNSISTMAIINTENKADIDINGDSVLDKVYLENSKIYIEINDSKTCLNDISTEKEFLNSNSYHTRIYFKKLSRNHSYDIIVQFQNNIDKFKCTTCIFTYSNNSFKEIYKASSNIFGIVNLNTNKTPECYFLDSKIGNSSKESIMIITDDVKNTSKYSKNLMDIESILKFIDIIQADYEITETYDIFSSNISSEELGIVWNLDKERNRYSFQNAYFENNCYDINNNESFSKWILSFEKYTLNDDDTNKEELILNVITQKDNDKYKISSITKESQENSYINN